jgi:hypothetical protein
VPSFSLTACASAMSWQKAQPFSAAAAIFIKSLNSGASVVAFSRIFRFSSQISANPVCGHK